MEAKLIKMLEGYIVSLTGDIDDIYAITNKELTEEHGFYSLSLKNCKEVENGYDLDEIIEQTKLTLEDSRISSYDSFRIGMETILEIIGDKNFSEEDMIKAMKEYALTWKNENEIIQSLQQTEWNVLVEVECCGNYSAPCNYNCEYGTKPKLDADGCLILRKI